ncbi:outer membrane protein assembly factor BamD [Echinicola strongylocentroti]|uniref:Outer membrane protein assembly factor BamD n=1 Tax=Echinicola strongylocentroti TaxID=1795355 RepID=A0A2Z4ILS0_9BACT|nr:outer membrane protein assembly factor BamD [Echinicola strongylocentroti]AWW31506.1 outer membrane protein assembly factor BamD [Echinicola strongylocentroti]
MKNTIKHILLLAMVVSLGACGKFYKLEKSTNWDEVYTAANEYYEKEEYNKAIILYDKVLPVIRGSEKSELAQFNYAYAHFRLKRYIEAASYFNTFYESYSRSPLAEESLFMHAYSLYLDAPDYNLDQQSSREAVSAIQQFINRFPQSDSYERAMGMIDNLQSRFEKKAYEEASMYYRLTEGLFPGQFYLACIVNFQNFAKSYPNSEHNEELAYKLVEVSSAYAERSVFSKKEERLNQALEFGDEFQRKYPKSEYNNDISSLITQTQEELDAHQKTKKQYDELRKLEQEAREKQEQKEKENPDLEQAVTPETGVNSNK